MPLKGKSVDSVPSKEKRISSRESVLSLIEFNKDRLTQIDREITRLTKKIDELSGREDLKQNDIFQFHRYKDEYQLFNTE